jgi:hypothetical protein
LEQGHAYELIEGNYYRGFLRFYLMGSKVKGEWTLQGIQGAKMKDMSAINGNFEKR